MIPDNLLEGFGVSISSAVHLELGYHKTENTDIAKLACSGRASAISPHGTSCGDHLAPAALNPFTTRHQVHICNQNIPYLLLYGCWRTKKESSVC